MNRDNFIIAVCLVAMVGIYMYNQGSFSPGEKHTQSIQASIIAKHRPRVIYFFTDSCGVCMRFRPVIENAVRVYGDCIDFQRVNANDASNISLIQQFNISGVPTTIVFDSDGQMVFSQAGFVDQAALNNVIGSVYMQAIKKSTKPNADSHKAHRLSSAKKGR